VSGQNQRTWHPTETHGAQGTGLCVCPLFIYSRLLEKHTEARFSSILNLQDILQLKDLPVVRQRFWQKSESNVLSLLRYVRSVKDH